MGVRGVWSIKKIPEYESLWNWFPVNQEFLKVLCGLQLLIFIYEIAGSKVFSIGHSYWDVAVAICRKTVAIRRSLVPVLTGIPKEISWSLLCFFKITTKRVLNCCNCCMGSLVSIQCHLRHGSFCMITLYWMFEVEDLKYLKLCLILRVLILLCNPSRDIWVMPTIEVRFNIICRCYGSVHIFLFFGVSGWAYC